jgi:hypothetical protein
MKKALLFIAALTFSAVSFAADTKPIEEVFQRYWSAYAKKDVAKAAADVLPSDLEDTKAALLPVFLAAQSHKDKEVQEMLSVFFGRTVGKARESMTAPEVYAGINRIVMAGNPPFFDALKDASISIIFVRTPAPEEAEIHYQVTLRGESDTDADKLIKKNGRWWVRVKEDPKEAAAQFKQLFENAGKMAPATK